MKKILSLMVFVCACTLSAWADQSFFANDSQVSYTGRVEKLSDGSVRYDWIGTYFQTDFTGGKIAIKVSETGESYHNVFIDDVWVKKIHIQGKHPQVIVLAEKLSKKVHRLRLQKCTEGQYGCTTIHQFLVADKAQLRAVPAKTRMIEVYGDSYTCGYGTEGKKASEPFRIDTENCNKAYGCIIDRYFDADYALIAHSGQGMVHDWGDKMQISVENMSTRFVQLFDAAQKTAYDFKVYHPDLVMINLGTNDYNPGMVPDIYQYVASYKKMIQTIRKHYGNIPILCVTPHSANGYLMASLQQLSKEVAGWSNVYFSQPMPNIVTEARDMGSDWHPNYQGQAKIAMTLIPQISAIMGWDLPIYAYKKY